MTTKTTTAAASVDYLYEQLPIYMPGVQVFDGEPTVDVGPQYVALTGWQLRQAPASLGNAMTQFQVEENYILSLYLRTFDGESQSSARQAALAIYDGIQQCVRSDPTFGGLIRVSWIVSWDLRQGRTTPSGCAAEADVGIHCEQRLQILL